MSPRRALSWWAPARLSYDGHYEGPSAGPVCFSHGRRQPSPQWNPSGSSSGGPRPGAHMASRNQVFIRLTPAGPSDGGFSYGGPHSDPQAADPGQVFIRRAPNVFSFGGPQPGLHSAGPIRAFIRRAPVKLSIGGQRPEFYTEGHGRQTLIRLTSVGL